MSDAALRKTIETINQTFADHMNKGDIAAACKVYTDDARLLPPDSKMVKGRKAIQEFWTAAIPALGVKRIAMRTIEATGSGTTAHEIGEATLTLPSGDVIIKFVVVWRQVSGQWHWAVDIWNNGATA